MDPVARRDFLRKGSIVTVGASGLAGCLGDGSDGGDGGGDDTITIGASISKSGDLAPEGKANSDGYNFMVEYLNEEYGGLEVDGETRPLELIEYDDESNCETAVRLVRQLITEDNVDLLLGPYSSDCVFAAGAVVRSHDQVMVGGGGGASRIYEEYNQDKPYIFLSTLNLLNYSKGSAEYPATEGAETIGMVTDNGAFSQAMAAGFRSLESEYSGGIVVDESIQQDARDVSSQVTQLVEADVDYAVINSQTSVVTQVFQEMRDREFNPDALYASKGVQTNELREALGNQLTGAMYSTFWTPDMPTPGAPYITNLEAKEIYGQYRENGTVEGLEPWSYRRAIGAGAMQVLAHGVEQAGSIDPDEVRQALLEIDIPTVAGVQIKYNDLGIPQNSGHCGQYKGDDQFDIVHPEEFATGDPIYPRPTWSELA